MFSKTKVNGVFAVILTFLGTSPAYCDELSTPRLYVFVSFSMPEKSLRGWAEQVNKVGGTLVLRGFHENSIQKTSARIMTLLGERTEVKVDPESFQRFQIKVVPSVVVADDKHFDVISGDISLEAALEKIISKGSIEVKQIAGEFLERYRKQK